MVCNTNCLTKRRKSGNILLIKPSLKAAVYLPPFGGGFFRRNMTIHHDKLAYGKLASARKELSEEEIKKMLETLNEEEREEKEDKDDGLARKD